MSTALILFGTVVLVAVLGSLFWEFVAWQKLDERTRAEQRTIKQADLAVHRASREYGKRVKAAERQVNRAAASPQRAKYGGLTLFDDRVTLGSHSFQLTAKTRAKVVGHGRGDERKVMVLLEDTSWSRSISATKVGKPNELDAQSFVAEARVCAANAVDNRARRSTAVADAQRQAASTVGNTAELDAARAARNALGARSPASGRPPGRRWRRAAAPVAVALLVFGGAVGSPTSEPKGVAADASPAVSEPASHPTGPDRVAARATARRMVASGDYAGAQRAVQNLAKADRSYVRRLGSNRAARVVRNALRRGDRTAAHRALLAADALPRTGALTSASLSYDAAVRSASRARRQYVAAIAAAARQRASARRAADAAAQVDDVTSSNGADFCSTHSCIDNFDNGRGSIVQCADGMWSKSGGISGACSRHGGVG